MRHLVVARETYELRCHSCSHGLGYAPRPMRLVGQFKASVLGDAPRIPRSHDNEVRRRCASCGWVNIFHPATASDVIELK